MSLLMFVLCAFLIFAVLAVGGFLLGGVGAVELSVALAFSIIGAWTWTFWKRRGWRPVEPSTRARE